MAFRYTIFKGLLSDRLGDAQAHLFYLLQKATLLLFGPFSDGTGLERFNTSCLSVLIFSLYGERPRPRLAVLEYAPPRCLLGLGDVSVSAR